MQGKEKLGQTPTRVKGPVGREWGTMPANQRQGKCRGEMPRLKHMPTREKGPDDDGGVTGEKYHIKVIKGDSSDKRKENWGTCPCYISY